MDNMNAVREMLRRFQNGDASEHEKRFLEKFYNLFDECEDADLTDDEYDNLKKAIKKNITDQISLRHLNK